MLFVPASRPAMIAKAAASLADAVCLDLEDSVLPDEKAASRGNVVRALQEIDFGHRVRMVRINSLDTEYAELDLMEVMEAAADRVDVVMMPKVASAADVVVRRPSPDAGRGGARPHAAHRHRGADRKRRRVPVCARDRQRLLAARGADLRTG